MAPTPRKKVVERGPPGRPKHSVWTQGFRRVLKQCEKSQRSVHAAYCVLCNKVLCNTASKRLNAHRRICPYDSNTYEVKPTHDTAKITKITAPENTTTITFVDIDETSDFPVEQKITSEKGEVSYLFVNEDQDFEEFKPTIPITNDHKVDLLLAKFFIGCNIPFSVADSPYFKNLCTAMNSSFKPINSDDLAGPLLNNVYSKIHNDNNVSLTAVLLIDGWKTDSNHSRTITVMLRTEANKSIFMDNYELSSNSKDSMQELTDITKSCIMEAMEQFKTDVYAVILGNNYTLKLEKDDELWQFPCNLKVLNSLIKDCVTHDFINIICKTLKHCNMVFKSNELDTKLGQNVRWDNLKFILQFCIDNMEIIQNVLVEDTHEIKITKDYKCNFFDMDFIRKMEICCNLLDSTNELLTICHSTKSTIADAIEQWLSLQISCEESDITDKVESWRDKALTMHGLVANYLHPAYRGQKLTGQQMNKVEEFLLSYLDAEGLESLQSYVNDEGIFKSLNQKENVTAKTYWGLARRTHVHLANLALKLLVIPAAITSNFSEYFNTIKNNSLKPEKLRKLFAVYYYLKENEGKMIESE